LLYGKTIGFQGRAMKNAVLKQIQDMEAQHATLNELAPFLSGLRQAAIWDEGDIEAGLVPVGQSIGLIHDVVSCEELLERMVKQAEALLKGSRLK